LSSQASAGAPSPQLFSPSKWERGRGEEAVTGFSTTAART
jgi:hypothetical protein